MTAFATPSPFQSALTRHPFPRAPVSPTLSAQAYFGGPDRRSNLRFRSIVDQGPDALDEEIRSFLKTLPPEAIEENPRAAWQTALEVLDTPGNIVRNVLYRPFGVEASSKETFAGLPKIYSSDALREAGWEPDSTVGKVGQFLTGLFGDFLLDPLTWMGGLAGFAAGTLLAGPVGGAAGAAGATSAVVWLKNLAKTAAAANKGLTVSKLAVNAGEATTAALRAAQRVHARRGAGVAKLVEFAEVGEKAGMGWDSIAYAAQQIEKLHPELLMSGRLGFGFGTSPARNFPLGHLIAGPPLIAGKAVFTGMELTGQAIKAARVPGARLIGTAIEQTARGLQLPLDLLGSVSDRLGTPLSRLPAKDVFYPARDIPVVGKGVRWLESSLKGSDVAVAAGEGLRKVGTAIKESAAKAGIGPKTGLAALILNRMNEAKAGIRKDVAPGGLIHETEELIQSASKEMGVPVDALRQILVNSQEFTGPVAQALAKGDRAGAVQALKDMRRADTAALEDILPIERVERNVDEIMATVHSATDTGPAEYLDAPDLMPLLGKGPRRKLSDIADVWQDEVRWLDQPEGMTGIGIGTVERPVAAEPRIPLQDGDIIIARIGGRMHRYREGMDVTTLPRNMIVVRPKPSSLAEFDPDFIAASLNASIHGTGRGKDRHGSMLLGTAQQDVRVSAIRGIPVRGEVPIGQQREFAEVVRAAEQQRQTAQAALEQARLLQRRVDRSVPELMPKKPRRLSKKVRAAMVDDDPNAGRGRKRRAPPRVGLKAAQERVAQHYTDAREFAEPGVSTDESSDLLGAGYTFSTAEEREQLASFMTSEEYSYFVRKGLMSVVKPGVEQGRRAGALPGMPKRGGKAATFEDDLSDLRDRMGGSYDNLDNVLKAMVASMREHRVRDDPGSQAEAVIRWFTGDATVREVLQSPELDYDIRVYQNIRDGALVVPKRPGKGKAAMAPEVVRGGDLTPGQWVRIAGESFEVTEVNKATKTVDVVPDAPKTSEELGYPASWDDLPGQQPAAPTTRDVAYDEVVLRGEGTESTFDGKTTHSGEVIHFGEPDTRQEYVLIDQGSIHSGEEHQRVLDEIDRVEAYRSPSHAAFGKQVRKAGLDEEQSLLFDAAIEDIHPEDLAKVDVKAMQGNFAGMYSSLTRTIQYGRGNLHASQEALHEVGHFAFDHIFSDTDRKAFTSWWLGKSVDERIALMQRGEGQRNLRVRYLAGDKLTADETKRLGLDEKQIRKYETAPEREGFAQQFAYYALVRRSGDRKVTGLFDRALDLLRRMWNRMSGQADADPGMMDLMESIFDPVSRTKGREMPDRVLNLQLPGMKYAGLSMDYKAGKAGDTAKARKYAAKAVTAKHAARLVADMQLDDAKNLILIPVPSATGSNTIPDAMAERLARLSGGKVRRLLETTVRQGRPGKGVIRRLANPKHFVGREFPGDLPAGAAVVLIDDTMHSGASLREASRQLWHTGVNVRGVVVGTKTGPTLDLRVSDAAVAELRRAVGERLPELETLIGMPVDGSHLTMAEFRELHARFRAGQSVDDIGAHLNEARRSPGLPDESAGPSIITESKTAVDDFPTERERILDNLRTLIADGDVRPSWQGVMEFGRRLSKKERLDLFGFTGLTNAKKNAEARQAIELVLLQLGHGIRGSGWEGVLDTLQSVSAGKPAYRTRAMLEQAGGLVQEKEGVRTLTLYGKQAMKAMEEAVRVGGDPGHVVRLTEDLQRLEAKRMQRLRQGRTIAPGDTHRIKTKRRILANMGKAIEDDAAYRDWLSAKEAGITQAPPGAPPPPGTPPAVAGGRDGGSGIRMPEPEEIYAAPVAKIVRQLNKVRAETQELERAAVVSPRLDTHRGLGYFPHYLGSASSVIGKVVRANGMIWEKEIARMLTLPKELRLAKKGKMSAADMIASVVKQENKSRRATGRPEIEAPAPDADISVAIGTLLEQNADLQVQHRSMLMRTYLHELSVAEINGLAEYTGVAFQTNPVAVWKARRTMAHLAVAGADFLREAIKLGIEDGFVVAVKGRGQTPEGFDRITDSRFGNIAKGYAFSNELVREFKKFQSLSEKPHVVLRALDWITSQWRTSVLGVAPYTMTNLVSGVFQANIFDAFRYKTWNGVRSMMMDIHAGVTGKTVNSYVKLPGEIGQYDIQDFYTMLAVEHGELGKGLHGIEMEKAVTDGLKTEWGILAQLKGSFVGDTKKEKVARGALGLYKDEKGLHLNLNEQAYFRGFRAFNVAVEDWMSMSFIAERLRRGDTMAMAIQKKRLALNQSADLTDFELNVFRRMIPFWGWFKGNAVLQFMAAVNRPQLAAAVTRIRGNLESAFVGDESLPPSLRPRHVAEELGVQLTGGSKPQFVNLTRFTPVREIGVTPFAGLDMPGNIAEEAIQRLNPVLKVPAENIINRDLYWDRKVEEYPEQRRRFLGVNLPPKGKRLARLVRQLNIVEQISWRGVPTSTSDAAFGAAQIAGVRAFPIDTQRQIFARERELNDTIGSVMRDLHRARTRAERDGRPWQQDPEVVRLAEVYGKLMDQREALPLKSMRASSKDWALERRGQRKELKAFAVERN